MAGGGSYIGRGRRQEPCFLAFSSVRVSITLELRWLPRHPPRSEPGQVSPLSGLQSTISQSLGSVKPQDSWQIALQTLWSKDGFLGVL